MARNREYEIRLSIDPDEAVRLISHRLMRPALRNREIGRQVSTYFDTPDTRLQRHRFGLRVRLAGHAVTQTLKQSGTSLVDRGEWERADAARTPDIPWLRRTPLARLLRDDAVAGALGPRFSVDVTRTTFRLAHEGATIEAALDHGTIQSDGLSLPLSELELEVKRGKPAAALHLARELARDLPLTLSLASKAERGYAVSDLTWGRPSETLAPPLRKRMTIAQAFEAIVQSCLNAFLKNLALIRDDGDGEAVHKSRIALRRLRAACQLFRPVLRRKRLAGLRKDVKWLSDRLGAARDADVFQAGTFEPAARHDSPAGAETLALVMADRRLRAHRRLRKALASPRARLLYLDLLAFSTDGIRRSRRRDRYRPFVRSAVTRCRRSLSRRAKGLSRQTAAQMHEVRKAAKMLRYDLDMFGTTSKLMRPKRQARLARGLKVLQQSLGEIHDQEAVRAHLCATVLTGSDSAGATSGEPGQMVQAAARIAASPVARAAQLRTACRAAKSLAGA